MHNIQIMNFKQSFLLKSHFINILKHVATIVQIIIQIMNFDFI